ncbi:hypothetical protein D3C72_1277370 [compost metagenome]
MALDAGAHVQEGAGGGPHLARAVRLEARHAFPPAEGLGGVGQALDGAHLIADEQHRHAQQQDGRYGQPQDEDMGLGRHGPFARRDDAQHAAWLLHADVDIGGIAGGVVPEGLVQPRGQGLLQDTVDHADRPAPLFIGQDRSVLKRDGELHRPLGPVGDDGQVLRRRLVAIAFGRPGHVPGQALGQARGHGLPVGVEEGPGHGALHDQHRQDDDQQRPAP